jgi:hypothetical protein
LVSTTERDAHPLGRAEHLRRVFGDARIVLLAVAVADPGAGLHDDARFGAVLAGLPGALGADPQAVPVRLGVLAEVPDVALAVLGVLVEGVLDEPAVSGDPVVHDHGGHAEDPLGAAGDLDGDRLRPLLPGALVAKAGARHEWQVRVVDRGLGREVGRGRSELGEPVAAVGGLWSSGMPRLSDAAYRGDVHSGRLEGPVKR